MSLPPVMLHLEVTRPPRRSVRLWLPLFLLWPLALMLGVLALPVAAVVDLVRLLCGRRDHHYAMLLVRLSALCCETRGLVIQIDKRNETVNLTVH